MDFSRESEFPPDLSPLAWVHDEVRRTLESVNKSLKRLLRQSDGATVAGALEAVAGPQSLNNVVAQVHQLSGVLDVVGLGAGGVLMRASEEVLKVLAAQTQPLDPATVDMLERAHFALLSLIDRMLAGKQVSTMGLFTSYRALREFVRAERIHPADVWQFFGPQGWRWQPIPPDASAQGLRVDAVRAVFEAALLKHMRQPAVSHARLLSDLCAGVAAGAPDLQGQCLWQLAAAQFQAQALGLLDIDIYVKRLGSRLLSQLRASATGDARVSERLAQDLLFYCAQARHPRADQAAQRLWDVLDAYGLRDEVVGDYEDESLGRVDPSWVAQAKRRVAGAKEFWSLAAEGDVQRLDGMDQQFAGVAEALERLFPSGEALGEALQRAAVATLRSQTAPSPGLAMEVATSLLYVEAALDDASYDTPEQLERVLALARRVLGASGGEAPQDLAPWMAELYRRVSDRQTLGSVVHELRSNLTAIEQQVDKFFRDSSQRELLIPVPAQFSAMRGVLSVLGLTQAAQACLRMRDEVDALITTEVDVQRGGVPQAFERLAHNLGALGLLIDMLSVQPQLAKRMFVFDDETGALLSQVGGSKPKAQPPVLRPQGVDIPVAAAASAEVVAQEVVQKAEQETADHPAEAIEASRSLLSQLEQATREVVAGERSSQALSRDLERLSLQAEAADETALAQVTQQAQRLLEGGPVAGHGAESEALPHALAPVPPELSSDPATTAVPEPVPAASHDAEQARAQAGESLQNFLSGHAPAASVAPPAVEVLPEGAALDQEMLEIFLEEAAEVTAEARAAADALEREPNERAPLTDIRRAFHTLKGSSRMVGLLEFGEAGWACEQLLNACLSEERQADATLLGFIREALVEFEQWAQDIAQQRAVVHSADSLRQRADALRLGAPVPQPGAAPVPAPASAERVGHDQAEAGLQPLELLTLDLDAEPLPAPTLVEADQPVPAAADFSPDTLVLDLPGAEELPLLPLAEPMQPAETVEAGVGSLAEPVAELPDFELPLEDGESALPPVSLEAMPEALPDEVPVAEVLGEEAWPGEFAPPEDTHASAAPMLPPTLHLVTSKPDEAETAPEGVGLEDAMTAAEREGETEAESVKVIGPLRISITLFNIFLNEADELSRRLSMELAEWALPLHPPVPASCEVLAHALAGNAATVGFDDLSQLARALEQALGRAARAQAFEPAQAQTFVRAAEDIRRLLHQFAAGFLKTPEPGMLEALEAYEPLALTSGEAQAKLDAKLDAKPDIDAIESELFPVFSEEAKDLLPELHANLREWQGRPQQLSFADACMRVLHTFKGGARLTGALHLGDQAHDLESAVELLARQAEVGAAQVAALQERADLLDTAFEALRAAQEGAAAQPKFASVVVDEMAPAVAVDLASDVAPDAAAVAAASDASAQVTAEAAQTGAATAELLPLPATQARELDWSRFEGGAEREAEPLALGGGQAVVRVQGSLLERMAAQAGEVSVRRARLESELSQMKGALLDLDDNLDRLRAQLRELEVQAETQISSRQEAAKLTGRDFDPLEFDRYTRFQELTRMMAESVNDVATVQRSLQRNLQQGEDELAGQVRLTRELQDDLLRTRMVEFDSLAERLHRVVRQAAREAGKQVQLEIVGGHVELDRAVLERMVGPFEHLLRNSVVHGIELPPQRAAHGKPEQGLIRIEVGQQGNEIELRFSDDGAGLDLARIRERGLAMGLLQADQAVGDEQLMQLVFTPGFSTAAALTASAGRGVGMDVVRAEVSTLGGFVQIHSTPQQGSVFTLRVPLTTALTQVVQVRCGELTVAIPASLMEAVIRVPVAQLEAAYRDAALSVGDQQLPLYWLGGLLEQGSHGVLLGRTLPVLLIRSAKQRLALHVDEVMGNQEVVVKNLGPQLIHLPGLAGISLLASGAVALIYNPVGLVNAYGAQVLRAQQTLLPEALRADAAAARPEAPLAPLVMVVDDSLTVRRVTQRLLEREGYRVLLAKDGLDAMERLGGDELPALILSDIEMPRMDGFDLVRNLRADPRLAELPVVMITSRIAQKHKDYAHELGVNDYLGKPYDEEHLLHLIARYTSSSLTHA